MSVYANAQHWLRVFFNTETNLWVVTRWDGAGGVTMADRLTISCNVPIETDGRFLRAHGELKINDANVFTNELVRTPHLRIVPNTQKVEPDPVQLRVT